MNPIHIQPSKRTPEVNFNFQKGNFLIKGNSMPENSEKFYAEVLEKFDRYAAKPGQQTVFLFQLNYYNTATARALTSIFKGLNKMHLDGNKIEVVWEYEQDDPDMADGAAYYQEMVQFTIQILPVQPK